MFTSMFILHNSNLLFFYLCVLQGHDKQFDLPTKKKDDVCTIMYTSGTTGDPKGVLISNKSIISLISGVDRFLHCVNEQVQSFLFLNFMMYSYGCSLGCVNQFLFWLCFVTCCYYYYY